MQVNIPVMSNDVTGVSNDITLLAPPQEQGLLTSLVANCAILLETGSCAIISQCGV